MIESTEKTQFFASIYTSYSITKTEFLMSNDLFSVELNIPLHGTTTDENPPRS